MAKKGLGKGLNSLFNEEDIEEVTSDITKSSEGDIKKVRMSLIEPNKKQPRRHFDEEKITALADSIKEHGLIQPIIITPSDNNMYKIVAGERRWRAAKKANLKEIPAVIRKYSEEQVAEIALIENLQRENLNPIEEAKAYEQLYNTYGLKQDEIAASVSKSRTAITNIMRLLKLDERVQNMVIENLISSGHGRTLLSIDDGDMQYQLAEKILDENLSVREAEKLVKCILEHKDNKKNVEEESSQEKSMIDFFENKMKDILGSKVVIKNKKNNKGKIEIEYYSKDELERIIDLIQSIKE